MTSPLPRRSARSTQLFLRIRHPSLDPSAITDALAIEPAHAICAGSDLSASGVRRLYSESYWLAPLPFPGPEVLSTPLLTRVNQLKSWAPELSKEDLRNLTQGAGMYEVSLVAWLRKLEVHREFFARVRQEQGNVTLLLQRGRRDTAVTISHGLAVRLAELCMDLEID